MLRLSAGTNKATQPQLLQFMECLFMRIFQNIALVSILLISSLGFAENTLTVKKYALIYAGTTTCTGCPEAIASIAEKAYLPVKYVKDPKLIPSLLDHAAIFIIGGTDDNIEPMRLAFNKNIVSALKEYIKQGGGYLGICGGGFIAAKYYVTGKKPQVKGFGIIPAIAVDYRKTTKAHLEKVQWLGENVSLYFQGGPMFILDKHAKDFKIIARYRNNNIAALEYLYGKGKVVVVGPHPEADQTWLDEDNINSPHWQAKQELALNIIRNMIKNQ